MSDKEAREHVAQILRKVIVEQGFKRGKRNGFVKEAEESMTSGRDERKCPYHWRPMREIGGQNHANRLSDSSLHRQRG
jgi:hypothetical protein